jgi:hypothetical protein
MELGWHPIKPRIPNLHFVCPTGSTLFINFFLDKDIVEILSPRLRGYPLYMQHGIGPGIPWSKICAISEPEQSEKKRKVKVESSIITWSKKEKTLKEIAVLAFFMTAI